MMVIRESFDIFAIGCAIVCVTIAVVLAVQTIREEFKDK